MSLAELMNSMKTLQEKWGVN